MENAKIESSAKKEEESKLPTSSSSSSSSSSRPAEKRSESQSEVSVAASRTKVNCASFAASLLEGFRYFKASVTGQVKQMRAGNEQEAAEASLMASKMQVDAAEEAENTKKQLYKSK